MPDAYLFCQNMRTFGGDADRTLAYCNGLVRRPGTGFPGIRGRRSLLISGLTEITNNNGSNTALPILFRSLGQEAYTNVACGQSALGYQEYVAIGVASSAEVVSVGRVVLNRSSDGVPVVLDRYPGPLPPSRAWCDAYPEGAADYRAPVYVVADLRIARREVRIAAAFVHNVYTLSQRDVLMALIGPIFQCIQSDPTEPRAVYLGGDFNTAPPVDRGTRRQGIISCYSAEPDAYPIPPAVQSGTTWNGRFYDYWYSNVADPLVADRTVRRPVPSASAATLTGDASTSSEISPMSDHAGILLGIA